MRKCLFFLVVLMLLIGCSSKSDHQTFNPVIPVEIDVLDSSDDNTCRNFVGSVQSEMKIAVSFPLGGTLTGIYVHNGQAVRKGQLIAKVDDTGAKSLHDAAAATLRQAEDGYRRLKQVYDEGGISEVRWVQMETDLEKARQTEVSTRKHLDECALYAPQDGVISMDKHNIGEQIGPAVPMCHVVDMNHLIVEFSASEKEIGFVHIGDRALATIPALNDKEVPIEIYDKAILANPLGHSYTIKARLMSDLNEILPGMVMKIRLALQNDEQSGIVVPSSCVRTMPEGIALWVIRNGKAYRQQVKVGEFIKNGVLVTEGLSQGDTIVTAGYQKLYNGAEVSF